MSINKISSPIRNIGYATAIRYFGRGFAELLIPLFIFSFVNNYTETGLISATYELTSIIALPLIGYVADKWGVKRLLTISLWLYPLLSISYFLAGELHIALFIVLARIINGLSYSLYAVGEKTAARTYASHHVSSNIGFVESLGNMLWIVAALLGVVRIGTTGIPSYYLLLLIAPTSLIGLYFISKLPKGKARPEIGSKVHHYKDIWMNIKKMPKKLKAYGFIYTCRSAFSALLRLIIPLYIYLDTNNIYLVVISGVLMTIPNLFSYHLGKIADKHTANSIRMGFALVGVLFLSFIIVPRYAGKMLILFILAIIFVFMSLMLDNLSNRFVHPSQYGRMEATFEVFAACGSIVGPIVGGIFMDNYGMTIMVLAIGVLALATSIFYHHKAKYLQHA